MIGIVRLDDLREQIPTCRTGIEGVQDHIASGWIVESASVVAVGIGDDGPIASRQGAGEQLADGRAFAGAGRADDLEMLGLIDGGQPLSGQREAAG